MSNNKIVNAALTEKSKIASALDNVLHQILDIEDCAKNFIPIAKKQHIDKVEKVLSDLSEHKITFENSEDSEKILIAKKGLRKVIRETERIINSSPIDTLEKSLFINLFATFDMYVGDLLEAVYNSNHILYKNISKEVPLFEILEYDSMDELKKNILNTEIEILRRKSYIEQFKDMEKKFSLKLTKFDSWPLFIELSQRRNLYTHCDGIVSKQYIDVCNSVGYKFKETPKIGDKLPIGNSYFFNACRTITEVAVMLGHTLWRKVLPHDIAKADSHLSELVFNFLHMEHWMNAISIGSFALNLPEKTNDEMERIFTINYAIALKSTGKEKEAKNILDKKDWSATTYDFKLAYAVVTNNYKDAYYLMKKMGQEGELIIELSYHDWPLFKDFVNSEEFTLGYREVYGYEYVSKLSSIAIEEKNKVENLAKKTDE